MDDEPMWAADRVVALTLGFAITIPKTANEFAITEFQSRSKQPNLDDDDIPMSRKEEAKFTQTFCRTRFYNDYRDHDSNSDNHRSSERNNYNQDNYQSHSDDKLDLQKQLSDFIIAQHLTNYFVKYTFMDIKNKLETTTKNHQASIQNLEAKFDRLADKQSGRPYGSLPSNTQLTQKVVHLNLTNQHKLKTSSDDEDDEPTPQPKPKNPKPVKEPPIPKLYKPTISYPQRLKKEKMEAQYGKFIDISEPSQSTIDVIEEILEEYFDALLNEGSKIPYSIEETILEEKLFAEFDEFMGMTTDENSKSESDTEEPPL
ncbi:hypothetical protein Tco_1032715 [Tanacetum coccineum]|uniref:Reverse transcriptase domain-containing protein n=1 Tax=Tanacetum coccineum TaxID=301880 RepID=A0ABQ5GE85_9ASTR